MTPKELVERMVILLGKAGAVPSTSNGKIVYNPTHNWGGNWVVIRYADKNCTLWLNLVFNFISKLLPAQKRFIPSECMECWKVVVRPENYDELLELKGLMEDMDFQSKLGIETRPEVDALYGAYFYNNSREEGLEKLDLVRFGLTGTRMKAFLKRGCSEYERDFGPSQDWHEIEGQKDIEAEVEKTIELDNYHHPQSIREVEKIMEDWETFANRFGPVYKGTHDYKTYEETNNGKS